MGVVDAGGLISATRQMTAVFEESKWISRLIPTRRRKRHASAMRSFVVACCNVLGTCRGSGVEVRCGGGGRGRVYLQHPTRENHVRVVWTHVQGWNYTTQKAACPSDE